MTKKELAVKVIVDSFKEDIDGIFKDWEITNWAGMFHAFGWDSEDCKEEIRYILDEYSNENHIDLYLDDDDEMVLENGEILKYRQLTNAVRKELFK